jgi:hypothetical protein
MGRPFTLTQALVSRFNAEIDFDGSKLLERYMARQDMPRMKDQFKRASLSENDEDFEAIIKSHGTQVVSMVGSEVCSSPAQPYDSHVVLR